MAHAISKLCHKMIQLRWLDTVFQGQDLPSLRINYVAINKDLEELTPQLYLIKRKICYDQSCNDIGVVIATKWRHYLFYLQQYFSVLKTVFQNRLLELFPPIVASMFVKFKRNLWERYRDIWCLTVICTKRSAFDMQFHLIAVSIFLKTCVKDHGDTSSRLLERRIWLVCIGALLLAVM